MIFSYYFDVFIAIYFSGWLYLTPMNLHSKCIMQNSIQPKLFNINENWDYWFSRIGNEFGKFQSRLFDGRCLLLLATWMPHYSYRFSVIVDCFAWLNCFCGSRRIESISILSDGTVSLFANCNKIPIPLLGIHFENRGNGVLSFK